MSNKLPISAFIITKDEEDRIEKAISSVKDWVDEVLIIDSGSTDKTVEISKKLGAKVIYNEWQGFGPQKSFGEKACKNDWIFNLDADEHAPLELKNEIIKVFENGDYKNYSAYRVKHCSFFWFEKKPKRFSRAQHFYRLYNRNYAGSQDISVHDLVVVRSGKIGKLKNPIIECSLRSFEHWIEKINMYTSMQANYLHQKKRRVSSLSLLTVHILSFLKAFILRRYFMYGIQGYVFSHVYAFSRLLKYAKLLDKVQESEIKNSKN